MKIFFPNKTCFMQVPKCLKKLFYLPKFCSFSSLVTIEIYQLMWQSEIRFPKFGEFRKHFSLSQSRHGSYSRYKVRETIRSIRSGVSTTKCAKALYHFCDDSWKFNHNSYVLITVSLVESTLRMNENLCQRTVFNVLYMYMYRPRTNEQFHSKGFKSNQTSLACIVFCIDGQKFLLGAKFTSCGVGVNRRSFSLIGNMRTMKITTRSGCVTMHTMRKRWLRWNCEMANV